MNWTTLTLSTYYVPQSWKQCEPRCTVTSMGEPRALWSHRQRGAEPYLKFRVDAGKASWRRQTLS